MILNLPYPISVNRYWRMFRNRAVLSSEAKAYKETVALIAQQNHQPMYHGNVSVKIWVQPRTNKDGSPSRVILDLDNCLKVVLDALQGVVYENDKQIKHIEAHYADKPIYGGGVIVDIQEA